MKDRQSIWKECMAKRNIMWKVWVWIPQENWIIKKNVLPNKTVAVKLRQLKNTERQTDRKKFRDNTETYL